MFSGFACPKSNWFRLPNDWFRIWRELRQQTGRSRIKGPLLVTEYVIKHTWGWQNFTEPVRLAWNDFLYGRRTQRRNLDRGTGLSRRALHRALEDAQALGLLEHPLDAADQPTYTYRPRMLPPDEASGFLANDANDASWHGFAPPVSNYFKVPALWTDMAARLGSEAAILSVEYLFRHTWGWEVWDGRACWLTEDEIANGRCYASGERYDTGIGYSARAVRDGLRAALTQGLLVWREQVGIRQYALYLQGMQVATDGEFLGWVAPPVETQAPLLPVPSAPEKPSPVASEACAGLQAQVAELTQLVAALLHVLNEAGITVPPRLLAASTPGWEASRPAGEESRPPAEASRPVAEASTPPSIQTRLTDTQEKTIPSSDTHAHLASSQNAGAAGVVLPLDILHALDQVGYHRTRKALAELQKAYAENPAYIRQWLDHLVHTRAGDPQVAGFFRKVVLRERLPFPGTSDGAGRSDCPQCHGAGVVLDSSGMHAVRCPVCAHGGELQTINNRNKISSQ